MILYTQSGEQFELCLSHVGMVIHSTTLDTEAKVKEYYGGNSWRKIEGRFLLGQSASYGINSTGGEATHTLTIAEMPSHSHPLKNDGSRLFFDTNSNGSSYWADNQYRIGIKRSIDYDTGIKTTNDIEIWYRNIVEDIGDSQPHNIMPPYRVVYIWERIS